MKCALLFWTNDPSILPICGTLTVRLDNGQETNIAGYYFTCPPDCVNRFGGYLYIEEGTYTYTVTSAFGCIIPGGTVKVIGNTCNFARIGS